MKIAAVIFATAVCHFSCAPCLANEHSQPVSTDTVAVLQLEQNHIYLGPVKVYLTPGAIKAVFLGKFRFALLSRAPKWDVVVYRTDDRLVCRQSLKTFLDQGLFSNMVFHQKSRFLEAPGTRRLRTISGIKVQQMRWPGTVFEYIPVKGNTAPQVEEIIYSAYKLTTNGQIPLRWVVSQSGKDWMTNLNEEGVRVYLSTRKISRTRIPAAEFVVPRGLTPEKSITRMVVGDANKLKDDGIDELF